jgi:hypothetical protein
MRKITSTEMIDMTSLLTMETTNLANAKVAREVVQNDELKAQLDSFIQASEGKVKGMQQFINENRIISEVQ